MDYGFECDICCNEFNEDNIIPKILDCGHSFCLSCIEGLAESRPNCPKCRKKLRDKTFKEYPTNFSLLEALKMNKSLLEIIGLPAEHILDKIKANKMHLSKILRKISTDLNQTHIDLTKLQDLTNSKDEIIDFNKTAVVLKYIESKYKESVNQSEYFSSKNKYKRNLTQSEFFISNDPTNIKFEDYESSERYLREIYEKLVNEEKVYAVKRIEDEMRYGKVSFENDIILFHALSETKIPKSSSLIWFDELKKCAPRNFLAFLKLTSNESGIITMFTINMFDSQYSTQFLRLCTGECGPTYKECQYERYSSDLPDDDQGLFQLKNYKLNNSSVNGPIDYLPLEEKYFKPIQVDEIYIEGKADGSFTVGRALSEIKSAYSIGIVKNPQSIREFLYCNDSPAKKIVDCGICIQLT